MATLRDKLWDHPKGTEIAIKMWNNIDCPVCGRKAKGHFGASAPTVHDIEHYSQIQRLWKDMIYSEATLLFEMLAAQED